MHVFTNVSKEASVERVRSFSDGVFSVIITVLVLDLHAPLEGEWSALLEVWPQAASYAVSYVFVAIVWVNHHHLLKFADLATPRLIWFNFAHLFMVSLLPFATAWIARTRLAAVPVCAYAGVFVLVNASYIALVTEAFDRREAPAISKAARQRMRIRSVVTLAAFALGGLVALQHPLVGFGIICCCLITYLRPDTGV